MSVLLGNMSRGKSVYSVVKRKKKAEKFSNKNVWLPNNQIEVPNIDKRLCLVIDVTFLYLHVRMCVVLNPVSCGSLFCVTGYRQSQLEGAGKTGFGCSMAGAQTCHRSLRSDGKWDKLGHTQCYLCKATSSLMPSLDPSSHGALAQAKQTVGPSAAPGWAYKMLQLHQESTAQAGTAAGPVLAMAEFSRFTLYQRPKSLRFLRAHRRGSSDTSSLLSSPCGFPQLSSDGSTLRNNKKKSLC